MRDEDGERIYGAQLLVEWPGGSKVVTIDKTGDWGADFPLWPGQVCAVSVMGLPSDKVEGIRTDHAGENYVFFLVFQRGKAAPPKPIARYLLLGDPRKAKAEVQVHFWLAGDYIRACEPVVGFRVEEAAQAAEVIILGGENVVSKEEEEFLRSQGCQVIRIAGSLQEIAQALEELIA